MNYLLTALSNFIGGDIQSPPQTKMISKDNYDTYCAKPQLISSVNVIEQIQKNMNEHDWDYIIDDKNNRYFIVADRSKIVKLDNKTKVVTDLLSDEIFIPSEDTYDVVNDRLLERTSLYDKLVWDKNERGILIFHRRRLTGRDVVYDLQRFDLDTRKLTTIMSFDYVAGGYIVNVDVDKDYNCYISVNFDRIYVVNPANPKLTILAGKEGGRRTIDYDDPKYSDDEFNRKIACEDFLFSCVGSLAYNSEDNTLLVLDMFFIRKIDLLKKQVSTLKPRDSDGNLVDINNVTSICADQQSNIYIIHGLTQLARIDAKENFTIIFDMKDKEDKERYEDGREKCISQICLHPGFDRHQTKIDFYYNNGTIQTVATDKSVISPTYDFSKMFEYTSVISDAECCIIH